MSTQCIPVAPCRQRRHGPTSRRRLVARRHGAFVCARIAVTCPPALARALAAYREDEARLRRARRLPRGSAVWSASQCAAYNAEVECREMVLAVSARAVARIVARMFPENPREDR